MAQSTSAYDSTLTQPNISFLIMPGAFTCVRVCNCQLEFIAAPILNALLVRVDYWTTVMCVLKHVSS